MSISGLCLLPGGSKANLLSSFSLIPLTNTRHLLYSKKIHNQPSLFVGRNKGGHCAPVQN